MVGEFDSGVRVHGAEQSWGCREFKGEEWWKMALWAGNDTIPGSPTAGQAKIPGKFRIHEQKWVGFS